MKRVRVVDSHTGGEPTRVVIAGMPDLGRGTVAERLEVFREHHDRFRSAVVNEPRGSDVLVGALLLEPSAKSRTRYLAEPNQFHSPPEIVPEKAELTSQKVKPVPKKVELTSLSREPVSLAT